MRTPNRAFTLLELAVALAIAGIVTAAALTATVSLQKSLVATRKTTELGDDARFTLEHLLSPLRIAGGNAIRPWQAISTTCRDDPRFPLPACVTAPTRSIKTRLHIVKLEPFGQCPIESLNGTQLRVAPVDGVCCVQAANGYAPSGAGAVPNPVVLFPRDDAGSRAKFGGSTWKARGCEPLTGGQCGCQLTDTKVGYDAPAPTGAAAVDADFVGGFVSRGNVTSYFVDPSNDHLMALFDITRTGIAIATDFTPRVVSFDTRLGYDADPVDGALDLPLVTAPNAAELDGLRVVRVGLAVASRVADDRSSTATMFGSTLNFPGKRVVASEGNATLRAVGVFQ